MIVNFKVLQVNESGETRTEPIFTNEYELIFAGQQIAFDGVIYRVNSLHWIDYDAGILEAVCLVFMM